MVSGDSDNTAAQMKVLDLEGEGDFGEEHFAHHLDDVFFDHFHELLFVGNLLCELGQDLGQDVAVFEADHLKMLRLGLVVIRLTNKRKALLSMSTQIKLINYQQTINQLNELILVIDILILRMN